MNRPEDDLPALRRQLTPVLLQNDLDLGYMAFVIEHLRKPDASWRWCCGSSCDPCVEKLGRTVDAARKLLDIQP